MDATVERARPVATVAWEPEDFAYGWREAAVRDPDGYLVILDAPA